MTTDKCFSCERKDVSPLCGICGIGMNGEREYYKRKPITNADRIRAMSDEELADFLCKVAYNTTPVGYYHIEGWLDWLKEEAKGEEE